MNATETLWEPDATAKGVTNASKPEVRLTVKAADLPSTVTVICGEPLQTSAFAQTVSAPEPRIVPELLPAFCSTTWSPVGARSSSQR